MRGRSDTIIFTVGGVALAAVLVLFGVTHYRALQAQQQTAQDSDPQATLNIPTIEAMCATSGPANSDTFKQCQADETASQEFVVAWMGFNGFLANGNIDLEQLQLQANLGGSDPFGLSSATDPSLGGDPSLAGDPSLGGDPSLSDPSLGGLTGGSATLGGAVDPVTGAESPTFQSTAELALYCLSESTDWTKLHDCIAENDPSSQLGGGP
jgi:hypothetical protein